MQKMYTEKLTPKNRTKLKKKNKNGEEAFFNLRTFSNFILHLLLLVFYIER